MPTPVRLSRSLPGLPDPYPVRIVHIGLGAFHRAHQAWYVHAANRAATEPTGIAAFTGRRPDAAVPLAEQNGLYTLIVRGPDEDSAEIITAISAAHDGRDVAALRRYLADPSVGIVTLTITEAGCHRAPDGGIDRTDPSVVSDIDALRSRSYDRLATAPARLLAALGGRMAADAGAVSVVPCDNLSENGAAARKLLVDLAAQVDSALRDWIEENVAFVSTMIDRITPATTDADRTAAAALTGYSDASPVVTEPFTEWVLAGADFADLESAGARFVADVQPFELRKLWLLNGSHSLLAYAAPARGHATVAAAVADPVCLRWIEEWWDEAARHLTLPAPETAAYRKALLDRYANPRIRHLLRQIAMDGSQKLPMRVVPVLRAERADGRMPLGGVRAIGGWIRHLRAGPVADPLAERLVAGAAARLEDAARFVLTVIAPDLADDGDLVAAVAAAAGELRA